MRPPLATLCGNLVALCAAGATAASTSTTVTTFERNADGAPTAVTVRVDGGPARRTYLTWDNFTPDAAAPSHGSVSLGDGNLVGLGITPGIGDQLGYDVRDRLTACGRDGGAPATYAYHPVSLLASSTLASGDALQFYYGNGATPHMLNTVQPSSGAAASFLGSVRYLSDGGEQILLAPRKDTAGVYDAEDETVAPYAYAPYGEAPPVPDVTSEPRGADAYDLDDNPFQYAGEYRDPTCDAYYLRARWYLPEQATFLSRDPGDWLHRYGYTGGNPVGRVDPTGLKYTGEDFSRDVDKLVGRLTPGAWAYAGPVLPVWGQVLGGIELAGLLPSFWHHPTTQGWITFGFLTASIAAEAGSAPRAVDRLAPFRLNPGRAFAMRLGIDTTLGASQTLAQSDRGGRVDVPALVQGAETTVAGIFWARAVAGIGYRPHNLTIDDVNRIGLDFHMDGGTNDQALVFTARRPIAGFPAFTNPLLEARSAGIYHEFVIAGGRSWVSTSELGALAMEGDQGIVDVHSVVTQHFAPRSVFLSHTLDAFGPASYRFVGTFDASDAWDAVRSSPTGVPFIEQQANHIRLGGRPMTTDYDVLSCNCHDHASGIVAQLHRQ